MAQATALCAPAKPLMRMMPTKKLAPMPGSAGRACLTSSGSSQRLAASECGISAQFFLELAPARIQMVDRLLRCVQFRASLLETDPIACNCGIFERRALGMEFLFRFADFPFHRSQFARFLIGELFPRRGSRRFAAF